jgi:hypothetical protein
VPGSRRRTALLSGSALAIALGLIAGLYIASQPSGGHVAVPSPGAVGKLPVPDFSFQLSGVRPIATGKAQGAQDAAQSVASRIQETLDHLYVTGFVDPNAWGQGNYDGIWQLFTPDAVATAHTDESTLTLGTRAGQTYRWLKPHEGRLRVRVLMDKLGHPSTAVALVDFTARGVRRDGHRGIVKSTGQFFLRPRARGWAIYGYQVSRDDGTLPKLEPKA